MKITASTPGVDLPNSVSLTAYSSSREANKTALSQTNSGIRSSELLLQSSTHPRFDFLGRESQTGPEALWNHYAAVYDPEKGTLQIIEARGMTVRGSLRERTKINEDSEDESDFGPTVCSSSSTRFIAVMSILIYSNVTDHARATQCSHRSIRYKTSSPLRPLSR